MLIIHIFIFHQVKTNKVSLLSLITLDMPNSNTNNAHEHITKEIISFNRVKSDLKSYIEVIIVSSIV